MIINYPSFCGNWYEGYSKHLKIKQSCDPSVLLLGIDSKECKPVYTRKTHVYHSTICNSQDM
jgi:hypothetical protein